MSTLPPGMSAPPPPPPPAASSSKRGCLIAVVVVLLLGLGGCTCAFYWLSHNSGKAMGWGLDRLRPTAMAAVSADVPADLKQQFETEYDAYAGFVKTPGNITEANGKVVTLPMTHIQQAMADKKLTSEEIEHFLELSRTARGASAPATP